MDGETLSQASRPNPREIATSGSFVIDAAAARRAVQLALPLLEQAVRDQDLGQSGVLHVVVMDPALTPLNSTFEQAILYEHSVGTPREQWDADYADFARAKASVSWHTGLDSHAVRFAEPYRLRAGDTTLWGSVALDGIIVGVSGAEPAFDEAIAGTVAMFLRALAKTSARNFDRQPFLQ